MTSQNQSILISSIYNSRKNILDLMNKQNYNINDYSNFSINEINSMRLNNQLDMLLEKNEEDDITKYKSKIYISYYISKKFTGVNLNEMIDDLFNIEETLNKKDTLFVIVKDEINESLMNELKHIWEKDGIFVVVENISRLQFNILEHVLVPFHRVMKQNEIKDVMIKYNITDISQFPDISRFDPVAKAICLRPGDVCEIVRPSKTAITSLYYRACV